VLVKFTYGGDANLDGKIDVDDYARIDSNVTTGNRGWSNGDFNYDGKINVDDYGIIDFNAMSQGAQIQSITSADTTVFGHPVEQPAGDQKTAAVIGLVTL